MLRAAALLTILLGGCAARPPEPLHTPKPRKRPVPDAPAAVAPPPPPPAAPADPPAADPPADPRIAAAMAQLDPTEYVRWPLGPNTHPALEPAYGIAAVLAQPGVSWLDLCRLGAQNRRGGGNADQLEYLRAWCDVANHDPAAAVARLAPLERSSVLGMPAAIRLDLANIVVDAGDADEASRLLGLARVDELAVFDLVAAAYAEIGRTADARAFNRRAIDGHDPRHPIDHCMRLTRRVLLAAPGDRTALIDDLAPFADVPACAALFHELECWDGKLCDPYLLAHGVPPQSLELADLYKDWPAPTASASDWIRLAGRTQWYPSSGDQGLSVGADALEAALRKLKCDTSRAAEIVDLARKFSQRTDNMTLRARFERIILAPDAACRR